MKIKNIGEESIHNICSSQVIFTLSSVVKELVENSIDANASEIKIKLVESGIKLIEVNDNGVGIKKINFENICARHATSKIKDFNDIHSSLNTLGFRGEALNSLCMLSNVNITTKNEENDHAYLLKFDKLGRLYHEEPIARLRGTTVSCENIFHNIPIRKKDFIKNIKTQLSDLLLLMQQYAIIYHNIKFVIYNIVTFKGCTKNMNLLITNGSDSIKKNFYSIYGKRNIGNLIEFNVDGNEWNIRGYISDSNSGRRDKDLQFYYINSRPIHILKNVNKLINTIYREFNSRLYPIIICNILSDTKNIDVNVTPDKREVFFTFEQEMCEHMKTVLVKLFTPKTSNLIDTQIDDYFLKANNILPNHIKGNIKMETHQEEHHHKSISPAQEEKTKEIKNDNIIKTEPNYNNDRTHNLYVKKECIHKDEQIYIKQEKINEQNNSYLDGSQHCNTHEDEEEKEKIIKKENIYSDHDDRQLFKIKEEKIYKHPNKYIQNDELYRDNTSSLNYSSLEKDYISIENKINNIQVKNDEFNSSSVFQNDDYNFRKIYRANNSFASTQESMHCDLFVSINKKQYENEQNEENEQSEQNEENEENKKKTEYTFYRNNEQEKSVYIKKEQEQFNSNNDEEIYSLGPLSVDNVIMENNKDDFSDMNNNVYQYKLESDVYNNSNNKSNIYEYKIDSDDNNDNIYEYKLNSDDNNDNNNNNNNVYEYKLHSDDNNDNNNNNVYEYKLHSDDNNDNVYEYKLNSDDNNNNNNNNNNVYEYKLHSDDNNDNNNNNVYEYKLHSDDTIDNNNNNVYEYKLHSDDKNNNNNNNVYEYKLHSDDNNDNIYEYKLNSDDSSNTTYLNGQEKNEGREEGNNLKDYTNYSFEDLKENIKSNCIKKIPIDINMYINREELKSGFDYDQIHVINLTNSEKIKNIIFQKMKEETPINNYLCLTDDQEDKEYKNLFEGNLSLKESNNNTNNVNNNEDINFSNIDETQTDLYFQSSLFNKLKICGQFNKGFVISKIDLLYFENRKKKKTEGDISTYKTHENNITNNINNEDYHNFNNDNNLISYNKHKSNYALFIIDQHAADEKSNFEKYNKIFTMKSQKLISKIHVQVSPAQVHIIQKYMSIFLQNGFEVQILEEPIHKRRKTNNNINEQIDEEEEMLMELNVYLLSLPVFNGKILEVVDFMSLLHHLTEHPVASYNESALSAKSTLDLNNKTDTWFNYNFPRPQKVWRILASKACRNAIMVGKSLNIYEMIKIKKKLSFLKNPWNCPHGRPTIKYLINNVDIKNCFKNYYLKLYDEITNLILTQNYDAYKYLFHNHVFFLIISTKPFLGPILKFQ
ncbi:putative DNA mismatch repair protein PMS1 [Plasmodium gaboni]|uniref:Putative DNA mismatch repair protein PMS1 n=1 Tax=Plasmodium gaboni TaxID=647221 RepID=A0A151LQC4_9APIC|nr:putative DNA mismatch repair protein PMS1 [Plasmodium gaboni]KYO01395.1 putative DNA mismatch repair protein PMS1 [Plasmodium gaboni]